MSANLDIRAKKPISLLENTTDSFAKTILLKLAEKYLNLPDIQ
jgi:hypothetical protein